MIQKNIVLAYLFVLLAANSIYGQSVAKPFEKHSGFTRFIYNEKVALKLDYFGELVLHPGLTIGIDYTVARKEWVVIHWDSELGGYLHRWNNNALFLKSSIGARWPINSLFVDLNLGAGYMHSFAAGIVYEESSEGGIEKAANWGHAHFMPTTSFLLGWDGTRKMDLPWSFHLGVEVYLQSSFNHIFLPHVAAKVGFTYKLRKL